MLEKLRMFKRLDALEKDVGYPKRNKMAMRHTTYQCLADNAETIDKITALLEAKFGEDCLTGIKTWRDKKSEARHD